MPGAMQEALNEILNPRVDPRKLLMRAVRAHSDNIVRTGAGRFTYRRPARRPGFGGTVRPSSFAPLPRIVVLIDTSGSMGQKDLGMAVGLVANVLNGLRLRDGVRVVCADTDIAWAGKVFDPSKIELRGRGGTDMGQAIVDVIAQSKRDEKPELIVVVTDGETGWPQKNVGVPVVACVTRKNRYYPVPGWIQTVYLKR
jgi:predicted metal-dependent peptidase